MKILAVFHLHKIMDSPEKIDHKSPLYLYKLPPPSNPSSFLAHHRIVPVHSDYSGDMFQPGDKLCQVVRIIDEDSEITVKQPFC